jgi:hypothetical protein
VLDWLGPHAVRASHLSPVFVGYMRFYEDAHITPLILLDGRIGLPEGIESHTPDWHAPES